GIDPQKQLGTTFYAQAKQRKLHVTPLETFAEQVKMFASFSDTLMAKWLILRAQQMLAEPSHIAADKRAWRSGDVDYLSKSQAREFNGHPKLYQLLVTARNQRWMHVLQDRLDTNGKPVFVIVGLGHLIGKDNLLDLLRARGYTVTQL
ncbi:MAG: TraB/GumN family protein, partial [Xanthomonadales bacterium]|nr:TraB/GumN family protein [Xanthomonadales bacterium]